MHMRTGALSLAGCTGLVFLTAWLFRMPLERAIVLAPIIVVSAGATAFIVALWVRVGMASLREARHPGRILLASFAVFAVLVVLSFFVELPARH